jgi:hypothetical protein
MQQRKKLIFLSVFGVMSLFILSQCFNKTQKAAEKKPVNKLITHKEAVDTMRADSNAPLKNLVIKPLKGNASYDFCKNNDLSDYFKNQYPKDGFFGEDHYRIEFVLSEVNRDSFNANIYHVKGKNRHKKVITPFEGEIQLIDIATFTDPNLDTAMYNGMGASNLYIASGKFELREDPKSKYSGVFRGDLKTEFASYENRRTDGRRDFESWFYSEKLPSGGAGYRFEGTWTSNFEQGVVKPVVWADDFFRFANEILKDFSYGEREVEINPKYRNLGWETLWENEEWWNDTKKPTM